MNRSLSAFLLFGTIFAPSFSVSSPAVSSALIPSFSLVTLPSPSIPSTQNPIPPTLAQTLSPASPAHLAQRTPIDFSTLRSQLQAQNWQAADQETRRILQTWLPPGGDLFNTPIASNIPPEVLQTLDRLWTEASNGRFGFRVQQRLWEEVRSQYPNDTSAAARHFGDRVGWTRLIRNGENFVSPNWLTEPELNYSLDAPIGHLPWAGVDWERIQAMLNVQSCGSCMIDAIDLQGERFHRYLPVLFNWLATALEAPIPEAGSWRQARLAYSIDLRTLYISNSSNNNINSTLNSVCPVHQLAEAISPDSTIVAISSYSDERSCSGNPNRQTPENRPENSTLALWNAERGNRIITLLRGHGDVANAVAFTPDSRLIAAGLSNGAVQLWKADRGETVRTLTGHRDVVQTIAISQDGQLLISASADQTVKLWHLETGELRRTIRLNSSDGIVHTLLISPDGQRLATATDRNTLQLWNAQTGQLIRTFTQAADLDSLLPIAFSPNGQVLAAGDRSEASAKGHTIKLWNASTGARLITLNGHTDEIRHLAFSPDSQLLASTDPKTAMLWNLQTYQSIRSFDLVQSAGHPVMPTNLGQVAFSPDGKALAASTLLLPLVESEPIPRQGLTLWDVATGQAIQQIHEVAQFQFSPNGQFLMANGQMVQIWQPYRSFSISN